ncbi:Hypothetical protein PHPALM_37073 [Phytophthora palmivora]|uniref:Uncharacterized protein n=1 Tax=Phytophthora palmivora TaxID=4796 RepID=A0A2P4WYC6_9STRA|nr:Hypothetical protein PHPALM_37073 [Phytophthora palmivora]
MVTWFHDYTPVLQFMLVKLDRLTFVLQQVFLNMQAFNFLDLVAIEASAGSEAIMVTWFHDYTPVLQFMLVKLDRLTFVLQQVFLNV